MGEMIINIKILRANNIPEYTAQRIVQKASKFKISKSQTILNDDGNFKCISMFKKSDWIKAQEAFTKTVRSNFIETNEKLLDLVKKIGEVR